VEMAIAAAFRQTIFHSGQLPFVLLEAKHRGWRAGVSRTGQRPAYEPAMVERRFE
jgi:hypothetical protein